MSDSMLGTVVGGRYRIESLLGQGGMCTVYRATDTRDGKPVAVKVLAADSARDPELGRRFQREITTGRRIQHPNVVAILDAGEIDQARFLVMELLDGKSLSTVLAHGRLSTVRSVAVARQMLAGLGAAHELGIAHRDVKPDNIFLVGDDVKILDFGIASNERAAEKLTAAGVAFGTPEYISPEMAMGLPTDARSDVYAAGVVLFQMLTGRLPFEHADEKALLRAHAHQEAPTIASIEPRIPAGLSVVVARALQKLPEERYPTAKAMIGALDEVLAEARRRVRRSRLLTGVVIAVAVLLGAGAFWLTHGR